MTMAKKVKKKLCWNCEGSASFEDEHCPYCGVYLNPLGGTEEQENHLFNAPYRLAEQDEQEIPSSPFADKAEEIAAINSKIIQKDPIPLQTSETKQILLPLVFLISGLMLFLFGIALALFSNHGALVLRWDASYWFLYFLISAPMLFFGWKTLNQLSHLPSDPT